MSDEERGFTGIKIESSIIYVMMPGISAVKGLRYGHRAQNPPSY